MRARLSDWLARSMTPPPPGAGPWSSSTTARPRSTPIPGAWPSHPTTSTSTSTSSRVTRARRRPPACSRLMNDGRIPRKDRSSSTFDDGYADLATAVRPRLERAGVPATMFLVSRAIGRDREFWWDALERAVLAPSVPAEPLRLTIDGSLRMWDVANSVGRSDAYREIWYALRARPPDERDRLAISVLEWSRLPTAARPSHRTLTNDEVGSVASGGLVEIGAHTADHAWLAGLSPEAKDDQIQRGRAEIEALIGKPIHAFAYPHGGPADIGNAANAVRDAGLGTGFVGTPGLVRPGTDRYHLPRVFVEDMDGEGFGRLLWRHAGIRVG